MLEGSIASVGSQYVLGLRAKNCRPHGERSEPPAFVFRAEWNPGIWNNRLREPLREWRNFTTPFKRGFGKTGGECGHQLAADSATFPAVLE